MKRTTKKKNTSNTRRHGCDDVGGGGGGHLAAGSILGHRQLPGESAACPLLLERLLLT